MKLSSSISTNESVYDWSLHAQFSPAYRLLEGNNQAADQPSSPETTPRGDGTAQYVPPPIDKIALPESGNSDETLSASENGGHDTRGVGHSLFAPQDDWINVRATETNHFNFSGAGLCVPTHPALDDRMFLDDGWNWAPGTAVSDDVPEVNLDWHQGADTPTVLPDRSGYVEGEYIL